ncbi:HIT-like protein [Coniophora puteana RWD-64-598 SS2]|uniref:HIT-like protein n=1 Tax=Coniophora puteana (strain RWD-64-598) TaxID=741705 RepID=A0A5M3MNL7_CONPW|nr:HIT-like protein [Coniophora puteana RWD-64-598 SS2]EIW80742.1 HIT-like protein [Coniophora puteana RWD-64-598 SS2]
MSGDNEVLKHFQFVRVLDENPATHYIALEGTLPDPANQIDRLSAVLRIEKTAFPADFAESLSVSPTKVEDGAEGGALSALKVIEKNDIYSWYRGWLAHRESAPDIKLSLIFPATEVHIRKYTKQNVLMVHETPALYLSVVKPYIDAIPLARTRWVTAILDGTSEADALLHNDQSPTTGFVLLPDMKWDRTTVGALYLVAIARDPALRSLRDLTKAHLPLLKEIRTTANHVVQERWGLGKGALRMYVHYQPSYYHFHVHIVHVAHAFPGGMNVGQAHLLDDLISLLELDTAVPATSSILARMTLTYSLGTQHGLYAPLAAAQASLAGASGL